MRHAQTIHHLDQITAPAHRLAGDDTDKPVEKPKEKAPRPSRDAILALKAEVRKCEERLAKLNEMRDKLAVKLARPELYERPEEAVIWQKKYAEVMDGLDRAEALWMAAAEKLEAAEA